MVRSPADEPLGVSLVGDIENGLPFGDELGGLTVVDRGRGQQLQPRVMMLVVVPGKEVLAEAPRILERFYRVRGTPGDGSGLGLAIAQEIARVHQGRLELQAGADARGLRVTLWLPG